jgi:large subunit ribosomal protein L35
VAKPRKIKRKLKTHRGAAKRFKVTSTGKFMRARAWKRHFTGTKRAKRMRHLRKSLVVNPADAEHVRRMLPYA